MIQGLPSVYNLIHVGLYLKLWQLKLIRYSIVSNFVLIKVLLYIPSKNTNNDLGFQL